MECGALVAVPAHDAPIGETRGVRRAVRVPGVLGPVLGSMAAVIWKRREVHRERVQITGTRGTRDSRDLALGFVADSQVDPRHPDEGDPQRPPVPRLSRGLAG